MNRDPLKRFLNAVRRRIWFDELLSQSRIAVLAASAALLLLAAANAFVGPIGFGWIAIISLLVAVTALLPVVSRRPTILASAVRADRAFKSRALLTTAWEAQSGLLSKPASNAAVISQAQTSVAEFWPRLGVLWRAPSPAAFALAAVPAFGAALLLGFATPERLTESVIDAGGISEAENVIDADAGVTELRESILRSAEVRNDNRSTAITETNSDEARNSLLPADAKEKHTTQLVDAGTRTNRFAAESDGGGAEAGDAQRTTASATRTPSVEFEHRIEEQIERSNTASVAGAGSSGEFDPIVAGTSFDRPVAIAAAAPPHLSAWTTMTAAEVAYARLYLKELQINSGATTAESTGRSADD